MERVIFQVLAYVVDANGTFNNLTGYPKIFDSKNYDNDTEKTYRRANGDYCEAVGAMSKIDTRQLQAAKLLCVNNGNVVASTLMGKLADLPDAEAKE